MDQEQTLAMFVCDSSTLLNISKVGVFGLRIVDSGWGQRVQDLPTRYLPPGNLSMLHAQFPGKVS